MRRQTGFTLMEVLLATTLLAAALALAFGILRAAAATTTRGEQMAQRNERMRAVSMFLRQRIGSALGIVYGFDKDTGASQRFSGDARSMQFVADLPDYLGRGGPHLHTLRLHEDGTGMVLEVDFQLVQAAKPVPVTRPPEPLADGLVAAEFAYRTLDEKGALGPWESTWPQTEGLPLQVRVRLRDARGPWPDMVVAPKVAGNYFVMRSPTTARTAKGGE